jgi:hypothetical protein
MRPDVVTVTDVDDTDVTGSSSARSRGSGLGEKEVADTACLSSEQSPDLIRA